MSKRTPKKTTTDPPQKTPRARTVERLRVTNSHAAGIDIHSEIHWVAVPPEDALPPPSDHPANLPANVRSFGACTADLHRLADWLAECGIKTVAMESTGIYWIPLFELLESRGFEVYLVDPRQSRHAPGRPKSDVLDCQWLQRLHSYGLLSASFRPSEQVVVLRSYLRQRQMLLRCAAQHVQHMQKALEQMNVKLTEVVADITGLTGMAIIKSILAGERDANKLAALRNVMCKRTRSEIARALEGSWRSEHLFALKQAVELYEFYHQKLRECDTQLDLHLQTFADRTEGQPLQPRPKGHSPTRGLRFPKFGGHEVNGVDSDQGVRRCLASVRRTRPSSSSPPSRWSPNRSSPSPKSHAGWASERTCSTPGRRRSSSGVTTPSPATATRHRPTTSCAA